MRFTKAAAGAIMLGAFLPACATVLLGSQDPAGALGALTRMAGGGAVLTTAGVIIGGSLFFFVSRMLRIQVWRCLTGAAASLLGFMAMRSILILLIGTPGDNVEDPGAFWFFVDSVAVYTGVAAAAFGAGLGQRKADADRA